MNGVLKTGALDQTRSGSLVPSTVSEAKSFTSRGRRTAPEPRCSSLNLQPSASGHEKTSTFFVGVSQDDTPALVQRRSMYIDRIDLSIPAEELQSVMEAFASAAATLELLPSVSPSDRKRYAKLGLKNEALALQIIEVGRANRHLIPAGLDFGKIDRDLVAREQLRTLKVILQGLLDRVSDSMLLTGVDLYAAALSMYHCLRRNADTASLKTTVAELKKGFSRSSRKKKEEELQPASAPAPVLPPISDTKQVIQQELDGGAPVDQRQDIPPTPEPRSDMPSISCGMVTHPAASVTGFPAAERHSPISLSPLTLQVHATPALLQFPQYGQPLLFWERFMPASEHVSIPKPQ